MSNQEEGRLMQAKTILPRTISISYKDTETKVTGKFIPVWENVLGIKSGFRTLILILAVENLLLEEQ